VVQKEGATFGECGWVEKISSIYINKFIMIDTLIFFTGFLLVLALVYGFKGYRELTFIFEAKTYDNPYYHTGLSFNKYTLDDGSTEEELILGLFFINIVLVFWKPA
jgi:hypothetical protein